MIFTNQRDEFDRRGLLQLSAAVSAGAAKQMRQRLWQHLEHAEGALPDRPETWRVVAPAHFQALTRSGAFAAMASATLLTAIDGLLGKAGWQAPQRWGRPLVTFPEDTPWHLPARGWHQDSSDRPGDPALVAFACLAPVLPQGGGTLVVAGSHRLTEPGTRYAGLRSAEVRDRVAADHPWFRDLLTPNREPDRTARLLAGTCLVDGIALEILELTGDTGDAFLMHPRLMHAVASNALGTPRLMLLQFVHGPVVT